MKALFNVKIKFLLQNQQIWVLFYHILEFFLWTVRLQLLCVFDNLNIKLNRKVVELSSNKF